MNEDDAMLAAQRDRLRAALYSGEPLRVAAALTELDKRRHEGEPLPVAQPDIEMLDAVKPVPEPVLLAFMRIVADDSACGPNMDPDARRRLLLEALLRHGSGRAALELALTLETDAEPSRQVRKVLSHLGSRGLHGPQELHAAQQLLSYLLDDPQVRAAALDALARLRGTAVFNALLDYVRPQLSAEEITHANTAVAPDAEL